MELLLLENALEMQSLNQSPLDYYCRVYYKAVLCFNRIKIPQDMSRELPESRIVDFSFSSLQFAVGYLIAIDLLDNTN